MKQSKLCHELFIFLILHLIEKSSLDAELASFIGDNYCDSTYAVIIVIAELIKLMLQKIEINE